MNYGFKNQSLDIRQNIDGIHFTPIERLIYQRSNGQLLAINNDGFVSDAGSIPILFQNIISSRGKLMFSFVLHDAAFQNKLLLYDETNDSWNPITLNEQESNDLIKESAESQRASELEIKAIYDALELFGWKAFRDDRSISPNG